MRMLVLIVLVAAAACALTSGAETPKRYVLKVLPDRPDGVYKVGEEVRFVITLLDEGRPQDAPAVSCVIRDDAGAVVFEGAPAAGADKALTARAQLDRPGVLRCAATFKNAAGEALTGEGGAAIAPLDLRPGAAVPEDFDAFWAEQRKQQAGLPLAPKLTPMPWEDKTVECFDVQVPCAATRPVSGYYARPAGARPKSLPALIYLQGAGVGTAKMIRPAQAAAGGAIALEINAHGIPNGQDRSYYDGLAKNELKDYGRHGIESRDTYYFRGMYARLMRALDFLCAQPEWDGKVLLAIGSSQGGSQAIAAAGLEPRVTGLVANVPAMCDMLRRAAGGWVESMASTAPAAERERQERIHRTLPYFDSAAFATRTKAEVIVLVGLIDNTCPAPGILAAYNCFPGRRQLLIRPDMGHATSPAYLQAQAELLARQTGRPVQSRPASAPAPDTRAN